MNRVCCDDLHAGSNDRDGDSGRGPDPVIAPLNIPPFIVEKYAKSLFEMMAGSVLLGSVFITSGLWLSYAYNITSGASIILVAGSVFRFIQLIERLTRLSFMRLFSRPC